MRSQEGWREAGVWAWPGSDGSFSLPVRRQGESEAGQQPHQLKKVLIEGEHTCAQRTHREDPLLCRGQHSENKTKVKSVLRAKPKYFFSL